MIYIEMTSIDSVFNYNLTSKYLKELGRIGYFLVYTNFGKEIKSYEFLKNLMLTNKKIVLYYGYKN